MTKTANPHAYNITVQEFVFEGEALFEARVKELPDVREYAESAQEAYELAIDTIETAASDIRRNEPAVPSTVQPAGRVQRARYASPFQEHASRAGERGRRRGGESQPTTRHRPYPLPGCSDGSGEGFGSHSGTSATARIIA